MPPGFSSHLSVEFCTILFNVYLVFQKIILLFRSIIIHNIVWITVVYVPVFTVINRFVLLYATALNFLGMDGNVFLRSVLFFLYVSVISKSWHHCIRVVYNRITFRIGASWTCAHKAEGTPFSTDCMYNIIYMNK